MFLPIRCHSCIFGSVCSGVWPDHRDARSTEIFQSALSYFTRKVKVIVRRNIPI